MNWFSSNQPKLGIWIFEDYIYKKGGFDSLNWGDGLILDSLFYQVATGADFIGNATNFLDLLKPMGSIIIFFDMLFKLTIRESQYTLDNFYRRLEMFQSCQDAVSLTY